MSNESTVQSCDTGTCITLGFNNVVTVYSGVIPSLDARGKYV